MTKDTDMQLVVRAIHYAAQQHSTQRRKDAAASPYINHPVALLNVLTDKDWRSMMTTLAPRVDRFVLTLAPTSPDSRAWDPAAAQAFAEAHGWAATLEPDFDRALALAGELGSTVLVTGSFHTVGDAMSRLQLSPLPD